MKTQILSGLATAAALLTSTSAFAQSATPVKTVMQPINYDLGRPPIVTRVSTPVRADDSSNFRVPSTPNERDVPNNVALLDRDRSGVTMQYRQPKMRAGLSFRASSDGSTDAGIAVGRQIIVRAEDVDVSYSPQTPRR